MVRSGKAVAAWSAVALPYGSQRRPDDLREETERMTRYRWQSVTVALFLAGVLPYVRPTPAQAQGGPPAMPKKFTFPEFGPGVGRFISTVDDFAGIVAVANIQGTGKDNQGNTLTWEVDVRAIQGVYVDPGG